MDSTPLRGLVGVPSLELLKLQRMQLIADSGSTKTSWRLVKDDNTTTEASTIGYNPAYFSTENMEASLRELLLPQLGVSPEAITAIYFYGAGCSTPKSIAVVEAAFRSIFPTAYIFVDHDLLGAARALCGKSPGVACILGTGSNSCAYDGHDITDNVPSLGFMLGDEGSGASLGRRLVRAFFYRELPKELEAAFQEKYALDKEAIFTHVYKSELPSRYMAQFTRFMGENSEHPFIREMIKAEFAAFVDTQVAKYADVEQQPVHFLGSIAFYFKPLLEEVLAERGFTFGRLLREPIEALVAFHQAD